MDNCLFCRIIKGEIPSKKVYEDEIAYAFLDISPQAPKHILVVPKNHIDGANDISKENSNVVAHIFCVIAQIAKEQGFDKTGYRIVNNCGKDGQQTVEHLHFHVLGGRQLSWPPG